MRYKVPHQVFLLNGPPRCGKDTAALHLMNFYSNLRHRKMSAPLKDAIHRMFMLSHDTITELELPGNNALKDVPRLDLLGMSYRQALIWMSEECMKPRFGIDVFGKIMVNELQKPTAAPFTVISDSGFKDEALPIIKRYGANNVHLFRILRPGCDFGGDSRSYWELEDACQFQIIDNRFDRRLFGIDILRRVDAIMKVERVYE